MRGNITENEETALVRRAHKGKIFSRRARGFSLGELAKAGMEALAAKRLGLSIDHRRRTVYDFNVDLLRKLASRPSVEHNLGESAEKTEEDEEELVQTVEATE